MMRDGLREAPESGDVVMLLRSRTATDAQYLGPDDLYASQALTVERLIDTVTVERSVTWRSVEYGETVETDAQSWRYHVLRVRDERDRVRVVRVLDHGLRGHDFEQEARRADRRHRGHAIHPATWGHAITVHKAQGTEWRSVLIVDQSDEQVERLDKDEAARWLYTAASRARERLVIADIEQIVELP